MRKTRIARWCRAELCTAVALLAVAGAAAASVDAVHLVSQPIGTDTGIWIVDVPLVLDGAAWDFPGYLVEQTTARGAIATFRGVENRNLASLEGLQVRLVQNGGPAGSVPRLPRGLFGDSLRVVLDLSGYQPDSVYGYPLGTLVPPTVACILSNAKRRSERYKFLDLQIRGGEEFSNLARVYKVADIPEPATPRVWDAK